MAALAGAAGVIVRFKEEDLASIRRHAEDTYPEECCGILIGTRVLSPDPGAESDAITVAEVLPGHNASGGDRSRHYEIATRDLLKAHKKALREGREVIGYYHSHPDSPACPSKLDRAAAIAGMTYMIVSVRRRMAEEPRCFRLRGAGDEFVEESWAIQG
jgi:proteasome lid subunit RPN8/RPN11